MANVDEWSPLEDGNTSLDQFYLERQINPGSELNRYTKKIMAAVRAKADAMQAEIDTLDDSAVHIEGDESVGGVKTFVAPIIGDMSVSLPVPEGVTPTPRLLTERFADVVSVRDFGAKGDGSDDTDAIKDAIAAAAGKTLFFPAGEYAVSCDEPVTDDGVVRACAFAIQNSMKIVGAGAKIVCDFSNISSLSVYASIFTVMASGVHFQGIDFVDASTSKKRCSAIAAGSTFDNVTDWSAGTKYTDISIKDCTLDGFFYGFSVEFFDTYAEPGCVSDVVIQGCRAGRYTSPGRESAPYHFRCPSAYVSGNTDVHFEPISNVTIADCTGAGFSNAATFGLYGVSRGVVSNCRSERNTQVGFQTENGANGILFSNITSIDDNTGIIVDDSCDVCISGFYYIGLTEQPGTLPNYAGGLVRPAIWVSFQGDDNLPGNRGKSLVGIEISNVTIKNGNITAEKFGTDQENPNVLRNLSISNASIVCDTSSQTGKKNGIFIASATCSAVLTNTSVSGFSFNSGASGTGILLSSVKTASIVNPVLTGNAASIVYNGSNPIAVFGGLWDVAPSGLLVSYALSALQSGSSQARQIDLVAGKLFGVHSGTSVQTLSARPGSVVALSDGTNGHLYLKYSGANDTTGWKKIVTNEFVGSFYPAAANTYNLGTATLTWKDVYQGAPANSVSDERLKSNVADVDGTLLDAWEEVGFRVFQFKEAIEEKGENARLHVGVVAQRIDEILSRHGVDASRYGFFCYDEWPDEEKEVTVIDSEAEYDADGSLISPEQSHTETVRTQTAGSRYGIRYEELLCIEAACQRRRADRLEARLAALEERLNGR